MNTVYRDENEVERLRERVRELEERLSPATAPTSLPHVDYDDAEDPR